MPSFNFALPIKAVTKSRSSNASNKYEKVQKDIYGVVCITIESKYYIEIGNDKYNIVDEDFSCKGKKEVYEQELSNGKFRVRHIRSNKVECGKDYFLPFAPGCCVKGNIVKHNITGRHLFKIKKVFVDNENTDARRAVRWYRNNLHQIIENRIKEKDE